MTRQTPPHSVEVAASDRSVLDELVVTAATIGVMLVAFGGAAATAAVLDSREPLALLVVTAVGVGIAVGTLLAANATGRHLATRLEARRHRRPREPAPVRLDTRPRGR